MVRLAWRGVSHDDLRPENVLVDDARPGPPGRLRPGELGQLRELPRAQPARARAAARRSATACSRPLRERCQAQPAARPAAPARGPRQPRPRTPTPAALPRLPPDAGAGAARAARRLAPRRRLAGASSPGRALAYYELDFGGLRLPGERPWAVRWRVLRQITALRGRRVLELGCNLGLLSIFLLKEAGAAAALAVDRDPLILEAAAQAARGLRRAAGVPPGRLRPRRRLGGGARGVPAGRRVRAERAQLGRGPGAPARLPRPLRRAGLRGPRQRKDRAPAPARRGLHPDRAGRHQRARPPDPALPQSSDRCPAAAADAAKRRVAEDTGAGQPPIAPARSGRPLASGQFRSWGEVSACLPAPDAAC